MGKRVINFEYDVPYAGGYSTDGQTIYIDRSVPDTFTAYDGKEYPLKEILIAHEKGEAAVLFETVPPVTYNYAHKLAVQEVDLAILLLRGIPVDEYYGALHLIVLSCLAKSRLPGAKLPPNLDMRPYLEDGIADLRVGSAE